MIVSFSGHRSERLGGYELPNPIYNAICKQTEAKLIELQPTKCLSGMCHGYDMFAALVCVRLGIPFAAIIPFIGQEKRWSDKTKRQYHSLLEKAVETVIVCDEFSIAAYQRRNEYLVDHCDEMIVAWDGSKGGTANYIEYAKKQEKPIHYLTIPKAG